MREASLPTATAAKPLHARLFSFFLEKALKSCRIPAILYLCNSFGVPTRGFARLNAQAGFFRPFFLFLPYICNLYMQRSRFGPCCPTFRRCPLPLRTVAFLPVVQMCTAVPADLIFPRSYPVCHFLSAPPLFSAACTALPAYPAHPQGHCFLSCTP